MRLYTQTLDDTVKKKTSTNSIVPLRCICYIWGNKSMLPNR